MEWCVSSDINEVWKCLAESNGEYLFPLLIVEVIWWILVIIGVRKMYWGFIKWKKRRYMKKQQQQGEEWKEWRKEQLDSGYDN